MQKFDEYYSKGKGGISFSMTGGQGQESRKVQFPDKNIINLDDIFKFTGNYGGSGGMGFLSNWMDKLGNYNASLDMLDYLGGNNVYSLPDKEQVAKDALGTYGGDKNNDDAYENPKVYHCKGCGSNYEAKDGGGISTTETTKEATDTVGSH